MKSLLVIAVLVGLVPESAEIVETAVQFAASGHSSRMDGGAEDDRGASNAEQGCSPIDHHCGCCARQAALVHVSVAVQRLSAVAPSPRGPHRDTGIEVVAPPLRPPIAA